MSIAIRTGSGPIIHRLLHHYTETHGTFIRPIIMYIFSIIALIKTQAYIENLFNSSLIKARQLIGSNGSCRRCPWDEDGSRPSPSHGDLSSTVLYSTVISLKRDWRARSVFWNEVFCSGNNRLVLLSIGERFANRQQSKFCSQLSSFAFCITIGISGITTAIFLVHFRTEYNKYRYSYQWTGPNGPNHNIKWSWRSFRIWFCFWWSYNITNFRRICCALNFLFKYYLYEDDLYFQRKTYLSTESYKNLQRRNTHTNIWFCLS